MRFSHPFENLEFEIPDRWWSDGGADLFVRDSSSFLALSDAAGSIELVPLESVAPPRRDAGVEGLREERTISLLRAMTRGVGVPAIQVHTPPGGKKFLVRDGFHRYYLAVALGFTQLPVSVRPYFNFDEL